MNSSIEGDLVRPLGFVTLNWAYAEAQLDEVLDALSRLSEGTPNKKALMFGAKILAALRIITELKMDRLDALAAILHEADPLIQVRNELIHGQLFNGGRLGGRLVTKCETKYITVQEISDIAERIFSWKEKLWMQYCRVLLPMLPPTPNRQAVQRHRSASGGSAR